MNEITILRRREKKLRKKIKLMSLRIRKQKTIDMLKANNEIKERHITELAMKHPHAFHDNQRTVVNEYQTSEEVNQDSVQATDRDGRPVLD